MMMRVKIVCLVVATSLGLLAPANLFAQPLSTQERARVEAVLEDLVAEGEPGVAVGIVREGEVVLEAYDGLANIAHGVSIGPETRINIASVAKQYVGLMTLNLAAQGEIDLEADFRIYLTEAMPSVSEKISVANLLTHTSGVRDYSTLRSLMGVTWYERPFNNRTALRLLNAQEELNFQPGSEYLYSNSNYVLLAEVIAAVTGQAFDAYARTFFDGIGMESTGWKRRYGLVLPNEAKGYMNFNGWIENPQIANYFGDGFLFTTLPDQMAWERQLQGADSSLPREVVIQSQTRPSSELPGNYGYGLELGTFATDRTVYHLGSTGGYNAYTLRLPDRKVSIVVMLNNGQIGVAQLGNRVAAALLDVPADEIFDYPAGPDELKPMPANADIVGRYELGGGTVVEVVEREGKLTREIAGAEPVALVHDEGNVFAYSTNSQLKIAFDKSADGKRQMSIYLPTQAVQVGQEIADLPIDDASRSSLEGCFFNAETRTEILVDWSEGNSFRMIKNGRSRDAQMVSTDYLRWNAYRLRFEREGKGQVVGLWVDNNRIRNVRFEPWDECRGESFGRFIPQ